MLFRILMELKSHQISECDDEASVSSEGSRNSGDPLPTCRVITHLLDISKLLYFLQAGKVHLTFDSLTHYHSYSDKKLHALLMPV